jgi:hypothetical protein
VEVMNREAEELNFGQAEETANLVIAEEMADFIEFEYLLQSTLDLVTPPRRGH